MDGKDSAMIRILYALIAIVGMAHAESVEFTVSFENGLNFRDLPERCAAGFVVGDTYNFDFRADGTARKRPGTIILGNAVDTCLGEVSAIIPNYGPRTVYSQHSIIAIRDSLWGISTGNVVDPMTFTNTSVPTGVWAYRPEVYSYAEYDNYLIAAGDMATPIISDGQSVYSLFINMFDANSKFAADTVAGGSLDSLVTYSYAYTFRTIYGYESEYKITATAPTTTSTARTCSLTNIPKYPPEFSNSSDTLQIASVNIYRSDGGDGYFWLDVINCASDFDGTYTDDGSLTRDLNTAITQEQFAVISPRYTASHADFMWYAGGGNEYNTIPSHILVTEDIDLTESVWTVSTSASSTSYALQPKQTGLAATARPINNTIDIIQDSNARFIQNGVKVGDWVAFQYYIGAVVTAVTSDTTIFISGSNVPDGIGAGIYAIGAGIVQMDDELVGAIALYGDLLYLGQYHVGGADRGIFGTTAATHSPGHIRVVDSEDRRRQLFYSINGNPLIVANQVENIIEVPSSAGEITGLVDGGDILYIFCRNATYALSGTDESSFTLYKLGDFGTSDPMSITRWGAGAIIDSYGDIGVVTTSSTQNVSQYVRDSLSVLSTTYDDVTAEVYDGDYYLSFPSTPQDTNSVYGSLFKMESTTGAWTKYRGIDASAMRSVTSSGAPHMLIGEGTYGEIRTFDTSVYTDDVPCTTSTRDIVCNLYTPTFNDPGYSFSFDRLRIGFDNSDSVRVSATVSDIDTTYTVLLKALSPAAGDTSWTPGRARYWTIDVGESGQSLQLRIWSSGDGRMVVYPGTLLATKREL